MVGEQFNQKYHLIKFIDSGSFGGVFLANEVIADRVIRQVALKIFLVENSQLDRQIDELRLATRLKHLHLLDCYSSEIGFDNEEDDEEDTYLGLAMEPATESLSQYLARQGTLPAQEVRNIITQIASALVFLHDNKIVHRDLKTANILRVGEVWKVADFGISRVLSQGTSTKTTQPMGTPIYQPPESYEGEIRPGWDIWSLGILLQEMLTGTHPFAAITNSELMMKVMMQEPEFSEGLSDEFLTILRGCLAKNPKERWTAQQVLDALQPRRDTLPSIDQLDLSSERPGINYYQLRVLLAANKWEEADRETAKRMLEVMGRERHRWLRPKDIENFPCKDLKIIDTLWCYYSHGRFGFSVQNKIWFECGSPTNYNDDLKRFGERLGWREGGRWISYKRIEKNQVGSLPILGWRGEWEFDRSFRRGCGCACYSSLAQRLVNCRK